MLTNSWTFDNTWCYQANKHFTKIVHHWKINSIITIKISKTRHANKHGIFSVTTKLAPSISKVLDNIPNPDTNIQHEYTSSNIPDVGTSKIRGLEMRQCEKWFRWLSNIVDTNIPTFKDSNSSDKENNPSEFE